LTSFQSEENEDLQKRSASAMAAFVRFCIQNKLTQPPEKIVKNLCTFLCQDAEQTPTFSCMRKIIKGILSFSLNSSLTSRSAKEAIGISDRGEGDKDEVQKAKLARRGASYAFKQLSEKFGEKLLDTIPTMWQSMAGGLLSACNSGTSNGSEHCLGPFTSPQTPWINQMN
jgi:TATA-binding protein-associated factor